MKQDRVEAALRAVIKDLGGIDLSGDFNVSSLPCCDLKSVAKTLTNYLTITEPTPWPRTIYIAGPDEAREAIEKLDSILREDKT